MEPSGSRPAQEQMRAIAQVSGCLAHDLRNPLGVIKNAAYLLRRRLVDQPALHDLLATIEDEVRVANAMVTGMAEMLCDRDLNCSVIDLAPMAREVAAQIPAGRHVQWIFKFSTEPFYVRCDPDRFRLVLHHLFRNAVEAMNARGEVTTVAGHSAADDCDTIDVCDSGPGFPSEIQERAFEPLLSTKRLAMGLGLPMSRRVMRRHGGDVRIEKPGPGAVVRVTLPRGAAGANSAHAGQSVQAKSTPATPPSAR